MLEKIRQITSRSRCVYSKADIETALDRMAHEITAQLAGSNPIILSVMIGGIIPTGHLVTRLDFPLQMDYVHVTRYGRDLRGGDLHWLVTPRISLKDRHILIVEDVLDGGLTLASIVDYCHKQGAASVRTAVVVDKQREREEGALQQADFTGLSIENKFLYGFGLDVEGYLRNVFSVNTVAKEDDAKS